MPGRIPTVADLAADPVTHHYEDMIAPSGLTNFLGTVEVTHDLTGLAAVTFPPISQGFARTAALFVDGRLFESFGAPVTHAWRPDRVVRSASVAGLAIETTTVCVSGRPAVAIDVRVTNETDAARDVTLSFAVNARVIQTGEAWMSAESPSVRNDVRLTSGATALTFADSWGDAWSVQGLDVAGSATVSAVPPSSVEGFEVGIGGAGRGGELAATLTLAPGQSGRLGYVQAVASTEQAALDAFGAVASDVPGAVAASESFWNAQLRAVFTPDDPEYSGSMPVLAFETPALERLYWWGILGVIWFRREWPGNVIGRSYDTLMPNYWATTTFIWDYSLSSLVHAMLDPVEMRRQLEHWIASDIHTMFGTSSLTGGTVGQWYSVNDYAMVRLVGDYVRITGDVAFLSHEIGAGDAAPQPVWKHLIAWATAWQKLRSSDSGLADYGEINNLLECVSTYTHEVASLNAANIWSMRAVAGLLDQVGQTNAAHELRAQASDLVPAILALYVPGAGYFGARQPDGAVIPVRHCYDFNIVGSLIAGDLPEPMRAEMVAFFQRELMTENWMHALSPWDPDASFSLRPDHQWNGAYPAWPADAARALVALGARPVALAWSEGLARTANQGPPGQAHFVEEAWPAIGGGARKAPPQLPYINDWACSSAGAWVEMVLALAEG
jgi:hypothetical protein